MNTQPYGHAARSWLNPDTQKPECLACGLPVTGWGETLRHQGEAFRPLVPPSVHADAVKAAVESGARALEEMPSDRVTDRDRARAVVERLYAEGALNLQRSKWKRPLKAA
ncbi:hypothetical protein [Microbispora sp. NPDC049125]|uniref:hypothetical protein n=1 Tax=Microbispora sp. NPDC049125 TaxID=3154929 RepID=UPI003466E607